MRLYGNGNGIGLISCVVLSSAFYLLNTRLLDKWRNPVIRMACRKTTTLNTALHLQNYRKSLKKRPVLNAGLFFK